jgi:hypothetical protein
MFIGVEGVMDGVAACSPVALLPRQVLPKEEQVSLTSNLAAHRAQFACSQ